MDKWVYHKPLCIIAPQLFELCECKDATVDKVRSGEVHITFRRWLLEDLRLSWEQIWRDALSFHLEVEADRIT